MKDYVIIFLLLLFDISFNNGYTLSKIELDNRADVYEIKEDKSSLAISYPNEKPTLREIVFYHIIERPYDDTNSKNPVINQVPDVDKERSFTNSHGYQFLEQIEHPTDNDDEPVNTKSGLDKAGEEIETITVITKVNTEVVDDNDEEFTDDQDKELTDDEDHELLIGSYESDETIVDVNTVALDVRFGDYHDNRTVLEEPGAKQIESESRSKRDIAYMEPHQKVKRTESTETFEENIEKQVGTLEKAVNNTPKENSDNADQKRRARTYGMSLMADGGVVWNDLNTAHVIYYVGELENVTSALKPEEVPDTTTRDTIIESTEDSFAENTVDESDDKKEDAGDFESKEIVESFNEIQKIFEELVKYSTSKPEVTASRAEEESTKPDSQRDISAENTLTETLNKNVGHTNSSSILKPDSKQNTTFEENLDTNKETYRKDKNIVTNKYEESKQQDFVKELMKNKYFWQWVKDSSAAYLEIMMKKVDALIKAEVDKQIQQYFKEHKADRSNCNPVDENSASEGSDKTTDITCADEIFNITKTPIGVSNKPNDNVLNKPEVDQPKGTANEKDELAKEHKDNGKNYGTPVHIEAQNVYGNSVGDEKVTNIFIFNMSKTSDLGDAKPLTNGTNGLFVFGLDNKKPVQEIQEKEGDEITDDHKSKNKNELNLENVTAKPEDPNELGHNIGTESKKNQQDINQISTEKPEIVRDPVKDAATDNILEETTSEEENENTMSEIEPTNVYATTENPSNEAAEIVKEQTDATEEQSKDLNKEEEHETE